MTLYDRIEELIAQHGSLSAAARVLQVTKPYLSRLRAGNMRNPGSILLKRMGIRKVVTYERIKE